MIHSVINTRVLYRQNVLRLLNNTDLAGVTLVVTAEGAGVRLGYVKTGRAEGYFAFQGKYRFGEELALLITGTQQIEDDALSTLRPDAGQFIELLNEVIDYISVGKNVLLQGCISFNCSG
jgi:hypothetical protein